MSSGTQTTPLRKITLILKVKTSLNIKQTQIIYCLNEWLIAPCMIINKCDFYRVLVDYRKCTLNIKIADDVTVITIPFHSFNNFADLSITVMILHG